MCVSARGCVRAWYCVHYVGSGNTCVVERIKRGEVKVEGERTRGKGGGMRT